MRNKLFAFLVRALFLTLNSQVSIRAQGAPGDLDTSFAGTGKYRLGFGAGSAAAVQSDGKLVLTGYDLSPTLINTYNKEFVLVRFGTNNAPDLAFGGEGKVTTPIGSMDYAVANAAGIQSDGKIVAAGYAENSSRTAPLISTSCSCATTRTVRWTVRSGAEEKPSRRLVASMSRKANCYDNASMEAFWSTLKLELIYRRQFSDARQVRQALFDYIEVFYNRQRLQSAVDYRTPAGFECANN